LLQYPPRVQVIEYNTTCLTRKECVVEEKRRSAFPPPKTSLIDYVTRVLTRQSAQTSFPQKRPVERSHKIVEIYSFDFLIPKYLQNRYKNPRKEISVAVDTLAMKSVAVKLSKRPGLITGHAALHTYSARRSKPTSWHFKSCSPN